ncbi:MAG: hypothetical protein EBU43_00710 [Actinobacteria bacterium]|nr:hypothetical protein [Actinomycetota bacterium]
MTRMVVEPGEWVKSAESLRRAGYDFFDQLGARVLADGKRELWLNVSNSSTGERAGISTRTGEPLPTLSHLWSGALWCEREADALAAFVLPRRSEKEWPGFADPSGRTRFTPVGFQGGK